jgi:hypothetical protein
MPSPLRLGEQTGTVKVRLLDAGDIELWYMRKYLLLASLDYPSINCVV